MFLLRFVARRRSPGVAPALALALAVAAAGPASALSSEAAADTKPSRFRSPDDGWFDLSAFLDEPYGFVPLAAPITEPAVGYGAVGTIAFLGRPSGVAGAEAYARPNVTAAGGLGTEDGTWGAFAGDLRHWRGGRLKTLVGAFDASVNLDFHGTGDSVLPEGRAVAYTLEPLGGLVRAQYRVRPKGRLWVGLGYALARTRFAFDAPAEAPGLPATPRQTRFGVLTPSLTYDSRDGFFTPARGTYVEAGAGFCDRAFGGEESFQRVTLLAMQFVPLHSRLTLGLRGDLGASYGEPPFYVRPYVSLRGAPAMRYQRDRVAQGEVELRWQLWKRFSVVGFAGHASAANRREGAEREATVTTGGGGVRYELARRYKLHVGADVAAGPDGAVLYIQFGSAWMRP